MVTVSGVSSVQKQSLEEVLQNRFQSCNFTKKRVQHRCFAMKFTKSLRTTFFTEHLATLMAASRSKPCKTMKTYTESLSAEKRNDIPERYF